MKGAMVLAAELLDPSSELFPQGNLRNADNRQRKTLLMRAQKAVQPGDLGSGKRAHSSHGSFDRTRRLHRLLKGGVSVQQGMDVIPSLAVVGQQTEVQEQVSSLFIGDDRMAQMRLRENLQIGFASQKPLVGLSDPLHRGLYLAGTDPRIGRQKRLL